MSRSTESFPVHPEPAPGVQVSLRRVRGRRPASTAPPHPHRHAYCEIIAFRRCRGVSHHVDFNAYTPRAGSVYVLRPQQVHFFAALPGTLVDFTVVSFARNALMQIADRPLQQLLIATRRSPELTLSRSARTSLFADLERLEHELNQRDGGTPAAVHAALVLVIVELARRTARSLRAASAPSQLPVYEAFCELLDQHTAQRLAISEYARRLGVSTRQLERICRQCAGVAPGALLQQRLMLEAKRMLYGTRLSVKAIALELGFSDPSHFHRFFRRLHGDTPGRFRAHVASGQSNVVSRH